jgi:hypothetical protein
MHEEAAGKWLTASRNRRAPIAKHKEIQAQGVQYGEKSHQCRFRRSSHHDFCATRLYIPALSYSIDGLPSI